MLKGEPIGFVIRVDLKNIFINKIIKNYDLSLTPPLNSKNHAASASHNRNNAIDELRL
jgi:hypothetical protein